MGIGLSRKMVLFTAEQMVMCWGGRGSECWVRTQELGERGLREEGASKKIGVLMVLENTTVDL